MTANQLLKMWREGEGTTLAELSRATGLSTAHLSDITNGNRGIPLKHTSKLAEALGREPADLVAWVLQDKLDEAGLALRVSVTKDG